MKQIIIPALPHPTLAELRKKYSWITKIERDVSETKEVKLSLISVLKKGEDHILGEEYEKRLPKGLLGFQHLEWLIEHQDEYPKLLKQAKDDNFSYIDFSGLVVVDEYGRRGVPFGYRFGWRWGAHWYWLGRNFGQDGRLAVSGQVAKPRTLGSSRNLESLGLVKRVAELEKWRKKVEKIIKI